MIINPDGKKMFFIYFKRVLFFTTLLVVSNQALAEARGLNWEGPKDSVVTPYREGDYHALIIGNNRYQDNNGMWKSLTTAVNDSTVLAELLRNEYGFKNVNLLHDATRKEILFALNEITDAVNPNDSVLIYYAGHGHLEEDKNRGYWIPSDALGGDHSTYLRNSTIRDEINIIAERTLHTLVISDSCFSGALMRSGTRGPQANESASNYYQKVANKKIVQVLTAGGKEYVDDSYRNSGHSPFTYFLINELKHNKQKMLSLAELATSVSIAVANNVEQTPQSGVLLGSGDELGQFIFAKATIKDNATELTRWCRNNKKQTS